MGERGKGGGVKKKVVGGPIKGILWGDVGKKGDELIYPGDKVAGV